MFYKASTFRQNLHAWLEWVIRDPKPKNWCNGGAVCDAPVALTSMPSISPSTLSPVTPSVVPSVALTLDWRGQFISSSEVQGQLRIYCQDPGNYDTSEYG